MTSLPLPLAPVIQLTREQFYQLCNVNYDLRLERSSTGDLILMPPTGWETGNQNSKLNLRVGTWAEQHGTGIVFDSSTEFSLPNGADRSPDVAWVEKSRIEAIAQHPAKFLPLAPDFVIELRSATDKLTTLERKLAEYRDSGVRLAWLIDPQEKQVQIYRFGRPTEYLNHPEQLSGEDVLPGFVLTLAETLG
jgi:Uma2 family endonuclease